MTRLLVVMLEPRPVLVRRMAVAIVAVLTVGVMAAWLKDPDSEQLRVTGRSTTTAPRVATSVRASTTTLPPGHSFIATATVANVAVFDRPDAAAPSQTFANPWHVNGDLNAPVPLVFHVQERRGNGWLRVLLPVRPNSSSGWIRAPDVTLAPTPYRITVERQAHRLVVYKGEAVLLEDTVAVGATGTPTPAGKFYIRALLRAPNPNTTYGPYAYGLSGHSETLEQFAGGDAEVGIHGNNDTSVLGTDASHGCIRMSNDAITRLTAILPLGTPVDII